MHGFDHSSLFSSNAYQSWQLMAERLCHSLLGSQVGEVMSLLFSHAEYFGSVSTSYTRHCCGFAFPSSSNKSGISTINVYNYIWMSLFCFFKVNSDTTSSCCRSLNSALVGRKPASRLRRRKKRRQSLKDQSSESGYDLIIPLR